MKRTSRYSLLALTGAAMLVLQWTPGLASWAQLERASLGEAWRLLSCHFVHFDPTHLFYSGGMLLGLGAFALRRDPRGAWLSVIFAALAIPAAILTLQPSITHYRGASGIDSALFALLAVDLLRDARRRDDRILGLGTAAVAGMFFLKIGYELVSGQAAFANTGAFAPVPLAHLVGAAVGVAVALLPKPRRERTLDAPEGANRFSGPSPKRSTMRWCLRRRHEHESHRRTQRPPRAPGLRPRSSP